MGDKRTKQRITSKIDELPEDLRMKVDVMLADTSNTYEYISQFLKGDMPPGQITPCRGFLKHRHRLTG